MKRLRVLVMVVGRSVIGHSGKRLHAEVYAHGRAGGVYLLRLFFLHLKRDEPAASPLRDACREDMSGLALCREVSSLLELDPSQAGKLNSVLFDVDRAGESEGAQAALAALEAGEADLPLELSLLLELGPPEEVGVRAVQVAQGLLGGAFGDLVEPGVFGLLARV